ncbi:hypothetical protein ACTHQ8_01400 [Lysinibacillus odysseyi]|uniref:Uncharacterized protein n=2 Tax=Lysinibacillus odysseyi TaxID=202611 RepID=A0A0A3IFB0_9BACI|nr:hypothetical protein [Lysinibacillus odysseyi]KGR83451.1 hypothetical protein CD32_16620 [Lysinibacillus odysseyi 34hs-1 = NBRC 100172]
MTSQAKTNVLNLEELQEQLNHVVFDHIDTALNWERAQSKLQPLYSQAVAYFKETVEQNDGAIPKENSHWMLFMHIASRLVYFENLIKQNMSASLDEASLDQITEGYVAAAKILPNCQSDYNEEYFNEINKSLQQLTEGKAAVEKVSAPLSECLQTFYRYIN